MEAVYARALKRHILPDQRLRHTRAAMLERTKALPTAPAVALLQDAVRFFDRFCRMSDNEIAALAFNGGGFVIGAEPNAPAWRMPPTTVSQPGEATKNFIASVNRRGVQLSLDRDGTLIIGPPGIVTEHDRRDIEARRDEIIAELRHMARAA